MTFLSRLTVSSLTLFRSYEMQDQSCYAVHRAIQSFCYCVIIAASYIPSRGYPWIQNKTHLVMRRPLLIQPTRSVQPLLIPYRYFVLRCPPSPKHIFPLHPTILIWQYLGNAFSRVLIIRSGREFPVQVVQGTVKSKVTNRNDPRIVWIIVELHGLDEGILSNDVLAVRKERYWVVFFVDKYMTFISDRSLALTGRCSRCRRLTGPSGEYTGRKQGKSRGDGGKQVYPHGDDLVYVRR